MPNLCKHKHHYFEEFPFQPGLLPTREEIRRFKLWQCPDCTKWISFEGVIKKNTEV